MLEKPSAMYTTIMTLGASRLPVDEGLPVELAVEVPPEQVGAAFAALQIDNHEIWSRSSLAARFPWVTGFLVGAAPGEVARFDDASGDFVLDE